MLIIKGLHKAPFHRFADQAFLSPVSVYPTFIESLSCRQLPAESWGPPAVAPADPGRACGDHALKNWESRERGKQRGQAAGAAAWEESLRGCRAGCLRPVLLERAGGRAGGRGEGLGGGGGRASRAWPAAKRQMHACLVILYNIIM